MKEDFGVVKKSIFTRRLRGFLFFVGAAKFWLGMDLTRARVLFFGRGNVDFERFMCTLLCCKIVKKCRIYSCCDDRIKINQSHRICMIVLWFLGEYSSEDESMNLSKYKKLTTEQELEDLKTEVTDTSFCEFFKILQLTINTGQG